MFCRKQEALAAANASEQEHGYSLAELLADARKAGKNRHVNPPEYRYPENPELTWSGPGRQPAWSKDGLEAGKALDDFLIARAWASPRRHKIKLRHGSRKSTGRFCPCCSLGRRRKGLVPVATVYVPDL